MKVVLAPVTGDKSETIALEAALDLADRVNGHLRAVHIRSGEEAKSALPRDLVKAVSGKAIKEVMKEAESQSRSRAKTASDMFKAFCSERSVPVAARPRKTEGVTAAWEEKKGDPHHVISIIGRLADLIVICRPTHKLDQNTGRFIKAALFDTASPLLLVPRKAPASIGKRIAIAWDNSAAAKRAVTSALPLLQMAEAVQIVSVGETTKLGPDARQLAAYLKWHGIETDVMVERIIKKAPEEALTEAFKAFKADMAVMGAYTRSRLQERIFGGVTRSMLNLKNLAILFQT